MNDSTPHSADAAWTTERHGDAVVATLGRPSVKNALNRASWRQLDEILDSTEADQTVRALILTGGPGIFSAGGDMKTVEGRGDGLMKDTARLEFLQTVLAHLARLPVPTIAAVEGPVVGVAWGLALACDIVVAGEGTVFMAPFAERRLVPDGGIPWHLARAVGRLRAAEILLVRGKLSADEALGLHLVSDVVEAGGALARALAISERLAGTSRDTTLLTLRALRRAEGTDFRAYLEAELELAALNLHNPDVAAARMNFKKPKDDR